MLLCGSFEREKNKKQKKTTHINRYQNQEIKNLDSRDDQDRPIS